MNKVSKRVKIYNYYIKVLDTDKFMKKIFNKVELLGEGGQGKVFKYCEKNNCKKSLVIKKIYLDNKQSKYVDDIFNIKAFKTGTFIELSSFYLINELVLQKISPNFILNYEYEFIERANSICNDIYPYTCYFYNEFIGKSMTYTEWVKDVHDIELWYNSLFQIMTAIYCLQKYFSMTHLDLHADNIIVKKVKAGGYWSYIINKKTYKLPNLGYVFYINDFGHAYIPDVFQSWFVNKRYNKKDIHKGFDIYQLFKSILKISSPPKKFNTTVRHIIKYLKKNDSNFLTIIEEIWGEFRSTTRKVNIETYNMDKVMSRKRIPSELKDLIN
jgi:hypothetical protein